MNVTNALLDRVAEVKGLTSDYQLAKELETNPQIVSNWRNNRRNMDMDTALMVADILGTDPLPIMAKLQLEKKHSKRAIRLWEKYVPRALLGPLITGLLLQPGDVQATGENADKECKEKLKEDAVRELYEKGKGKHAVIEDGKIRYLTDEEWEKERVNKTPVIRTDDVTASTFSESGIYIIRSWYLGLIGMFDRAIWDLINRCSAPRGA